MYSVRSLMLPGRIPEVSSMSKTLTYTPAAYLAKLRWT